MSKPRILIVEDDPHAAAFLQAQLQAAGYTLIGIAASAAEATHLARNHSPDLVLMDIVLHGELDGITAVEHINRVTDVPVLYLTAQLDQAQFERAKITAPFGCLLKPVKERELLMAVEMALYRHQLESRLRRSEKHLVDAQRIGHLGSWHMNLATGHIHWSDEIFRIFGMPVTAGGINYEILLDRVHPEDRPLVDTAIQNALDLGQHFSIYHRIVQYGGTNERVVHHTGEVELNESGKPQHLTGTLQDVTEHKSTEARLWHMAHHDPLCGLPNRLLMYDRLGHALARNRRSKQQLALMLFDLDDFKQVNDHYGHQVGDSLLVSISDRLCRCARESDTVARLGGDEFTLIIEQLKDPRDAAIVAQKIVDTMQEPVCLDGHNFQVTCSIGIALYPDDAKSLDGLLKAADSAMYEAKRFGKNNFHFYSDVKRHTH